jgi:Concanavalin A-like lectin/glucanases superfamily/Glycosyltransferase WbsX
MFHRFAGMAAYALAFVSVVNAWAGAREADIRIHSFLPVRPIARAKRPATVAAVIENMGDADVEVAVALILPDGLRLVDPTSPVTIVVESSRDVAVCWAIKADEAKPYELRIEASCGDTPAATASLTMSFLSALEQKTLPYIPEPKPVASDVLIGAHHCPLWEADRPEMWSQLLKHPERTPALGFYAGEDPEVSDWETKWAVEHGIDFFIYCWYRSSQGGPVETRFSAAIHDALFKSKFVDQMKFTIMWENQLRGQSGVAGEQDLMENLFPYWMDNYFKHPSYLKVDNKPVLFIYRPEFLIEDLGSIENVVRAFDLMRQACRDAGFDGLYLLGEYRGLDPKHLDLMKQLGLDYSFAYCWHILDDPTPEQAIKKQMEYINKTQDLAILPQVVTVSQAWSGWRDEGSIWKIPPTEFEDLLRQAKDFIGTLPSEELGSQMLILDNWNEWGEGHYIAPYREYGFGYVDAVRNVFCDVPANHVDLIPEDIGMGPYDTAYKDFIQRDKELRKLVSKKVHKGHAPEDGLIGWWSFDEETDAPVALDYSGHRLGGMLHKAGRAPGIDGNALVCEGGCVEVPTNSRLSPTDALTIACWVKSDTAGQGNTWFVNRVFSSGTHTGYRMGILNGKPCFEVPLTEWSHHLVADMDLPMGRWVHLAGTFDGKTMRIYVDGEERGSMERPGPINQNDFHLVLGNYEVKHAAHFEGLLDEIKLYERALSAEEMWKCYGQFAGKD